MPLSRRQMVLVLTGGLLASSVHTPAAAAPMSISLRTRNRGSAVDVTVRLSMNVGPVNFSNRSFGPIRVPRNGQQVVRQFNTAGIIIKIVLTIVGVILTVATFGIAAGGLVLAQAQISRTISG